MTAVNRSMMIAERTGPSLCESRAKCAIPQSMSTVIPAHWNASVNVMRTAAAPASRRKSMGFRWLPSQDGSGALTILLDQDGPEQRAGSIPHDLHADAEENERREAIDYIHGGVS